MAARSGFSVTSTDGMNVTEKKREEIVLRKKYLCCSGIKT